jgi:hypothetical protein
MTGHSQNKGQLSLILVKNEVRSNCVKCALLCYGLHFEVNSIKLCSRHLQINTKRESYNYLIEYENHGLWHNSRT